MIKNRIIKKINGHGGTFYYPQRNYRYFFIFTKWLYFTDSAFGIDIDLYFCSEDEALDFISDHNKDRIFKEEVIEVEDVK